MKNQPHLAGLNWVFKRFVEVEVGQGCVEEGLVLSEVVLQGDGQ